MAVVIVHGEVDPVIEYCKGREQWTFNEAGRFPKAAASNSLHSGTMLVASPQTRSVVFISSLRRVLQAGKGILRRHGPVSSEDEVFSYQLYKRFL